MHCHLRLPVWLVVRNAPSYQISSKIGQLRLGSCDLIVSHLGTVRHLVFDHKWILTIPWPPRTHIVPAYQISTQSGSYCEAVIGDLTHFPPTVFFRSGFVLSFSRTWEPNYITFRKNIQQSSALAKFVLDCKRLSVSKRGPLEGDRGIFFTTCSN